MSKVIDQYISVNNIVGALEECIVSNQPHLGLLLAKICLDSQAETSDKFYELYVRLTQLVKETNTCNTIAQTSERIVQTTPSDQGLLKDKSNIKHANRDVSSEHCLIKQLNSEVPIRVMLYCNWLESKDLCEIWNKMSKGNYRWNSIQIVWEEPADYYVVINCPPINVFPEPKKTIVFRMEPNMELNENMWGSWSKPSKEDYLWVGFHNEHYNNNEWHLSKTYNELMTEEIRKNEEVACILSTVLSDKYKDPGHIKRVDFVKFLEKKGLAVHVYGGNKFLWSDYKGSLPYHSKDNSILPYKYTFNVENFSIRGYYTEKLIDGILGECLTCYSGCVDIGDYIDKRAFVWLELVDFEKDYQTIQRMISEDWWSQRIGVIRNEKRRILSDLQFFPRLERIIKKKIEQKS